MVFKVFYGIPLKFEENKWLHEELRKYGEVEVIDVAEFWIKLRRWRPRSVFGELLHVFISCIQALTLLCRTNKNDIVVTRSHGVGLIFMFLVNVLNMNRRMISYNWIDVPKKRYSTLARIALRKDNFIPVVNDKKLLDLIKEKYKFKEMLGVYIPDTYDTKDVFISPSCKNEKYVFSGGINNRDWKVLLQVAKNNKNMKFKIAVNKYLWTEKDIPDNVEIYFDLSLSDYNRILSKSHICIIPLKEDRVSGLINIIKAHQYGVPSITTNAGCTNIYYPTKHIEKCLYELGDYSSLNEKLRNMNLLSNDEYLRLANELQQYLMTNFSGNILVRQLIDYIYKVNWVA